LVTGSYCSFDDLENPSHPSEFVSMWLFPYIVLRWYFTVYLDGLPDNCRTVVSIEGKYTP
jgi:hypothetical protein